MGEVEAYGEGVKVASNELKLKYPTFRAHIEAMCRGRPLGSEISGLSSLPVHRGRAPVEHRLAARAVKMNS